MEGCFIRVINHQIWIAVFYTPFIYIISVVEAKPKTHSEVMFHLNLATHFLNHFRFTIWYLACYNYPFCNQHSYLSEIQYHLET